MNSKSFPLLEKSSILSYNVKRVPKERIKKRKCDTEKKEKKRIYKYTFTDPTNEDYDIRVCQKMFLDTLCVSTHSKQKKLDAWREEIVMTHIKSFKVVESLLDNQFLPQNLSVKEMHRMYGKRIQTGEVRFLQKSFQKKILKEDLKFQKPKKDQCDTCTAYKNDKNKTPEKDASQQKHISDKDYARVIKEEKKQ